ncbi:MAG: hypothetical protein JWQ90_378 [Hydrocarboniphaga sp.]|uniref:DUF4845 domain-containing protein n=1 Tax=Hydrocarboniphaga sp. TaxID=2033016 RepID=UPI0026252EED|nr:DUF4845 domain-containing protein [Hydrocarboniphaga sp.]MDB5967928.1 hypothetical protein [Hydrocarboniphaga sp.]
MRSPRKQAGLTLISMLFLFGLIAFFATLVIKCLPLYLNQMKIARALDGVSEDPEVSASDAANIRMHLQRRWIIESIDTVKPEDVKIRRNDAGRAMVYDYEARAHLFYNIDIVVHFVGDVPLRTAVND